MVLLLHHSESRKPSNTGQLAAQCLENSQVALHGAPAGEKACGLMPWPASTQPLLLFPHADATPFSTWANHPQPITLVVPDGTWRQAFKMRRRVPGLSALPCVASPIGDPTRYQLRSEKLAGGLATMEAIARAMGVFEGPEVERALLHVFRVMVERTLWARGLMATHKVTGGIPPGALSHDPMGDLSCRDLSRPGEPAE